MQHFPTPSTASTSPSDDLKAVLDTARAQIDQEFSIAERLDNKARNQIALAGTWYALTQAIAGIAFRHHDLQSSWSIFIAVFAAFGGITLAGTMWHSYRVWELRPERDFSPDAIRDMLSDAESDRPVIEGLVRTYAKTLETRRANNASRDQSFTISTNWWVVACALTLVEILVALAAILF